MKIQKSLMKKEKHMHNQLEQYFKQLLQKVIMVLPLYLIILDKNILIRILIAHLVIKKCKKNMQNKRTEEKQKKKEIKGVQLTKETKTKKKKKGFC